MPPIKNLCFLLIFLTASLNGLADEGTCHTIGATLTFKNGKKQHVYFSQSLSLQNDEQGFYYSENLEKMRLRSETKERDVLEISATDYHFSNYVKRILDDSIYVYENVFLIYCPEREYSIPMLAYVNRARKISTKNIGDIIVHRVYILSCGTGIETKISPEDIKWLTGAKITHVEDAGGFEGCAYRAIFFKENTEQVKSLLNELKNLYLQQSTEHSKEYKLILQEIENVEKKLLEEHVLITGSCSC